MEDIDAGRKNSQRWITEYRLERCRQITLARFALRMRYGAKDAYLGATHSYDRFYRLDEAPSYELAMGLDHARWQSGLSHVLAWEEQN